MHYWIVFYLLMGGSFGSYMSDVLRPAFEKSFNDKCNSNKYPFIEQHYKNLENPSSNKFVHFVFHENGLKNGGFGDRLAGLITAAAIAFRFNRTLLIESSNGFDQLFRPYHPHIKDYLKPENNELVIEFYENDGLTRKPYSPNYTNWTSWTDYNILDANHDETEYDLWNCLNNNAGMTGICSMDQGKEKRREVQF